MASIDRMIAEIEAYLATPMKDVDSYWEQFERRSLQKILDQLNDRKREAG